jgi:diacylglycerol kinase family enzyme
VSVLTFSLVANANSGAVSQLGDATLVALANSLIGAKLKSCVLSESSDICGELELAFNSDSDAVIVIGGDGTCRSAAKYALETNKPVALLPGGTMNLLPAKHWPGQNISTALQALGHGHFRETSIDVGQVNDEIFLIAAAFGVAPTLARMREMHRSSNGIVGNLQALLKIPQVMPYLMRPTVRLEAKNVAKKPVAALAIVIGNADFALGRTDNEMIDHRFECVGTNPSSSWDFVRVMFRAFMDPKWRDDELVFTASIREGWVFSKSRAIAMTLDGEVIRMVSPAHIHFLKRGMNALVYESPDAALIVAEA